MPRGGKRGHKGGRRHFTDPRALEEAQAKEAKEKEWRKQRGELSESESGEEDEDDKKSAGSDESSSEESSSGDEDGRKTKGAEGLIEIENPNRVQPKQKKVTALDNDIGAGAKQQLSRREREELEKQRAKAHYQKLHAAGKTEEARADLARLAIIKKQREEAAKKREEEKKAKEEAMAKAKSAKK